MNQGRRQALLHQILACPMCHRKMTASGVSHIECVACHQRATFHNGKVIFGGEIYSQESKHEAIYLFKESLKAIFPSYYRRLVKIFSPVYSSGTVEAFLRTINPSSATVVELGSGCDRNHPDIINVDFVPYEEVDLVGSIAALPIASDSVDSVISIAVLEHVPDPERAVREIYRILKEGGTFCIMIPFMQGIHAAPDDFQRYTPNGLKQLCREFRDLQVFVAGGPTSALVWMLQEWLAMVLSFGSQKLYAFWYFVLFILSPLKVFDALLQFHPAAKQIASIYTICGRK